MTIAQEKLGNFLLWRDNFNRKYGRYFEALVYAALLIGGFAVGYAYDEKPTIQNCNQFIADEYHTPVVQYCISQLKDNPIINVSWNQSDYTGFIFEENYTSPLQIYQIK